MAIKTEFEIKVLDINVSELESRILELGGKKLGSVNYKRYIFDSVPIVPGRWIRLRTDGSETTLTFKDAKRNTIDGVDELELSVSDFKAMKQIMNYLGAKPRLYQENRRIKYQLNKAEVVFDFWPKIPPYLEIEGPSEKVVRDILKRLELSTKNTTSDTTEAIYRLYGLTLSDYRILEL